MVQIFHIVSNKSELWESLSVKKRLFLHPTVQGSSKWSPDILMNFRIACEAWFSSPYVKVS